MGRIGTFHSRPLQCPSTQRRRGTFRGGSPSPGALGCGVAEAIDKGAGANGPPGGVRACLVWGVGVLAYVTAVLHRTSFGVSGLDAAARFNASPGALSGFVVLQLVVYAGLQVPVGLLLDRFGSRALIAMGATVMAAGQLLLALTTVLPLAIVARVLVGAGDALTFISVLRLVAAWFPVRRVPVLTQLTGIVGQLGQVLSAVPLVALLHGPGWTVAFGSAAGLGGCSWWSSYWRWPATPRAVRLRAARCCTRWTCPDSFARRGAIPVRGWGSSPTSARNSPAPSSRCSGAFPTS